MKGDVEKGSNVPLNRNEEEVEYQATEQRIGGREGRDKMSFTCPACATYITTQIALSRSPEADAAFNGRYIRIAILFLVFLVGVIVATVLYFQEKEAPTAQNYFFGALAIIFLGILPLVSVGLIYLCLRNNFQDVQHTCPNCEQVLGISLGARAWNHQDRSTAGPAAEMAYAYLTRNK